MIKLTRDLQQYKDVENFKQYELTTCVAYEFAIRNKDLKATIELFLQEYIEKDLQSGNLITSTLDMNDHAQILMNKYCISPFNIYLKYTFYKTIETEITRVIKLLKDSDDLLADRAAESLEKLFLIANEYEYIDTPEKDEKIAKLMGNTVEQEKKWSTLKGTSLFESFIQYGEKEDDNGGITKSLYHSWIKPHYSRPALYVSPDIAKITDIKLNLALPTKDLVDFIDRLKKEISIATLSPYDLLAKELNFFNQRELGSKSVFSNQHKLADVLFIYDATQIGMSLSEIKKELWAYKGDTKSNFMDSKTINKYLSISQDYIDGMRYKELIVDVDK